MRMTRTGLARAAPVEPPAPSAADRAILRELTRAECDALLGRQSVARLAYGFRGRISIAPIHYVYGDGWLVGRTSPGYKLRVLAHSPWVALEVDEVRGLLDWDSVVVEGTFYQLRRAGTATNGASWTRAVAMLRRLMPETLGADDPVPFRDVLFQVRADTVTGRSARPGASGASSSGPHHDGHGAVAGAVADPGRPAVR